MFVNDDLSDLVSLLLMAEWLIHTPALLLARPLEDHVLRVGHVVLDFVIIVRTEADRDGASRAPSARGPDAERGCVTDPAPSS